MKTEKEDNDKNPGHPRRVNESDLMRLISLQSYDGNPGERAQRYRDLLESEPDGEQAALLCLRIGQALETAGDNMAAIDIYKRGLAMNPMNDEVLYLLNNNLGYCLNNCGMHVDARGYCAKAIRINPHRHNAHKNLGISLQGQGQYIEAAKCFMKAVEIAPHDPRAFWYLEDLLAKYANLRVEVDGLEEFMRASEPEAREVEMIAGRMKDACNM